MFVCIMYCCCNYRKKDINIKNRAHYFFNENLDVNIKSYKNILTYYIGYVTVKKDLKICSVNPLYLIFNKMNGYFEEINEKSI